MTGTPTFSAGASGSVDGAIADSYGPVFYVNTFNGATLGNARSPKNAANTMAQVFDIMGDMQAVKAGSSSNATIYVLGDIREQVTAPLGVYGGRIVGLANGNGRNTTSNGVELPSNGVQWREPATAASTPLLTLREQGWVMQNMFFYPGSTATAAVQLHREENATYPDASHAQFINCKFFGAGALGTATGTGIADYGGQYDVSVDGCQFINLVHAMEMTNVAIAAPLMWRVGLKQGNLFQLNTNDIETNGSGWVVANNQFLTPYNVSTHVNTVNMAFTTTTTYGNRVYNNAFADAAANVVIAKGYVKGNTSDVWRNYVTDTAAFVVTVPA
jgi:hypothetical protein